MEVKLKLKLLEVQNINSEIPLWPVSANRPAVKVYSYQNSLRHSLGNVTSMLKNMVICFRVPKPFKDFIAPENEKKLNRSYMKVNLIKIK